MFVIELVYKADLSRIDAHMAAHMKFLKKYYASGHFVVSGRKIPRDGGIILAVGKSKDEIALMREAAQTAAGLIMAIEEARSEVEVAAGVATRAGEQSAKAVDVSKALSAQVEAIESILGLIRKAIQLP